MKFRFVAAFEDDEDNPHGWDFKFSEDGTGRAWGHHAYIMDKVLRPSIKKGKRVNHVLRDGHWRWEAW